MKAIVMGSAAITNHVSAAHSREIRAEFSELLSGCGIFDLAGRAKIRLTGGDRVRWLNGMVTNNIRDLAVGRGVYAFLLNPQGHILGDLYAYNRGDSILIDSERTQLEKLLATFDRYIIMDDVEVADVTSEITAIGLAGPKARTVLQTAGIDLPSLEPLQMTEIHSNTIVRGDMPGVDSYEIWLAPGDREQLWNLLTKSGGKPTGEAALELLHIAAGVPRYGQDIRERDLPQETEQARALNFNKGCYIGQEIIERIRSRGAVHRKFTGFEVEGNLPTPGATIQSDGREIGEITSAATLPLAANDRSVALGYIRREMATSGRKFQLQNTALAIANLPFAGVFPG
jgi:folate-binding protein YgfZ